MKKALVLAAVIGLGYLVGTIARDKYAAWQAARATK